MIRVAFFPNEPRWLNNPYLRLLSTALENCGCQFSRPPSDHLQWRWLLSQRGQIDVLHFHWLDYHYSAPSAGRSTLRALKFLAKLVVARLAGYRVVWTMHNLLPHDSAQPFADRLVRRGMLGLAQAVLVHCEAARSELFEQFGRRSHVIITPHGSYQTAYPNDCTRQAARAQLGLAADDIVWCTIGRLRPYKGLEQFVEQFSKLEDTRLKWLIAGPAFDAGLAQFLSQAAQADPRIRFEPQYIADERLQVYFKAADLSVLPYARVLTSGSAILALSFGCPVLAPQSGCLGELITPECGFAYPANDAHAQALAIQASLSSDLTPLRAGALHRAGALRWEETANKTMQAYSPHSSSNQPGI